MVRRIRRDVPTENSSIYTHGHLKKLDGVVTNYMSGIGTWEPISGAATAPAPPDKSVQFNDGLTAFGGSAFFLFDKVQGRASLGNQSALTANVTFYVKGNLTYNVYSDGADSGNAFLGNSGFGVIPGFGSLGSGSPSTTLLAADTSSGNNFNFRSTGNTTRNYVDGKWEVRGHAHFGNIGGAGYAATTSAATVIDAADAFSGAMSAGTYSTVSASSTYAPSSGNPSVVEGSFLARASSGDFTNFEGVLGEAYFNGNGTVGGIFGGVAIGWAVNVDAIVTDRIVGQDAQAINNSSIAGTLPIMAGLQAIATNLDNQPVTNQCGALILANLDTGSSVVNNYGIYVTDQVVGQTRCYNIWSDHGGAGANTGKNFFGAGAQIGATDLNISRFAANILGIGTGAEGSVAGTLRCAAAGIGGNVSGSEELTVAGQASISGSLAIAGAISGSEELTVTGDGSITGYWNAGSYKVGGVAGASGNFTTVDLKTVTVVNGLITSIA